MKDPVFEYLARQGFIRRGRVSSEAVHKLSAGQVIRTAQELATLTRGSKNTSAGSFRHAASLSLGGSREHCRNIDCRTRSGQELVQFALLYSDCVFIRSYFAGHSYDAGVVEHSPDDARDNLLGDLRVLNALRPAIEARYVQLYTPPTADCPQCLAMETFGGKADKRLAKATRQLGQRFLTEVDVDLLFFEEEWSTTFSGPEDLLGHSGAVYADEPPDSLRRYPRLLQRVASGEMVRLSKTAQANLGVHHFLAAEVIQNVVFEILANQQLATSLLTDRKADVDVLNAIGGDRQGEERNRIALECLTSLVPFVANVPASALLRLRNREQEAFAMYRAALNEAMNVYKTQGRMSPKLASQLYGDVLEPKLALLDQRVRTARRAIGSELRRDITAWVGAISFGIYSGVLPATLAVAAKGIGMTAVVASVLVRAMKDPSKEVQTDQFYFLWRVREEARKRKKSRATA